MPAVLLHGFAGTARHWDRVVALGVDAVAPGLDDADPLTPDGVAALVAASAGGPLTLAGYSMGARLALHAALAADIERHDIEWFVERWRALPLFAHDPPWVAEEVAREERRCTPAALAASLRTFGPGAMVPMWGRLCELAMPVAVLAGERDERYVAAARRLAREIPHAHLEIVPGAGHRLALEAPAEVARALR